MALDNPQNYLELPMYLTNVFITLHFMSRFLFQLRLGNGWVILYWKVHITYLFNKHIFNELLFDGITLLK